MIDEKKMKASKELRVTSFTSFKDMPRNTKPSVTAISKARPKVKKEKDNERSERERT